MILPSFLSISYISCHFFFTSFIILFNYTIFPLFTHVSSILFTSLFIVFLSPIFILPVSHLFIVTPFLRLYWCLYSYFTLALLFITPSHVFFAFIGIVICFSIPDWRFIRIIIFLYLTSFLPLFIFPSFTLFHLSSSFLSLPFRRSSLFHHLYTSFIFILFLLYIHSVPFFFYPFS